MNAPTRKKIEYSPQWAPHVKGVYDERTYDEDGLLEESLVEARCDHPGCGATYRRKCSSGHSREHITSFARVHLHRDPLQDPFPGRAPGSRTPG